MDVEFYQKLFSASIEITTWGFYSSVCCCGISRWFADIENPGILWINATWTWCAAAAKSLQSCPTLCDPIDGSPLGSTVPGILQARTLEWVAISFFNAWKWKVKVKLLCRVRPSATPWTTAYQPPPSLGFSRQEYWSGVLLLSPFFSLGPTNLQDSVHLHNSPPASIWWEHWLGTSINPLPFGIIFPPRRLQEPCSGWCW